MNKIRIHYCYQTQYLILFGCNIMCIMCSVNEDMLNICSSNEVFLNIHTFAIYSFYGVGKLLYV